VFARIAIAVSGFVFVGAVAFTVAFVDDRRDSHGALNSATATPIPSATADPRLLTESAVDPDYKRVASPLGGWSMELPTAWTARPARVRGAEIASFELSSAELSGNAPSADQLRMSVTLQTIFDGRTLEQLGMDGVPPFLLIEQSHVTIAGVQAVRTTHRAYQPSGSPFDLVHVRWTFRSPHFSDRVTTIDVWPADATLRGAGDRAVASLQFAVPRSLPSVPTISRAQAIAKVALPGYRIDREAAKLVTYREYVEASNAKAPPDGPRLLAGPDPDPDELVWVVVIAGDLGPMPRGGPPRPGILLATPATTRWIMSLLNASGGASGSGTWSPNGDWPEWFDALKDRSP
jgi:hypothetical protein